jgi:hypothetical protein
MPSRYEQLLDAHSAITPRRWRPFATRTPRTYLDAGNAWGASAYGYKQIADRVAKEFYDRNEINETLFPPIFFLYRHWIELGLKHIWAEYFSHGLLEDEPLKSHDISVL